MQYHAVLPGFLYFQNSLICFVRNLGCFQEFVNFVHLNPQKHVSNACLEVKDCTCEVRSTTIVIIPWNNVNLSSIESIPGGYSWLVHYNAGLYYPFGIWIMVFVASDSTSTQYLALHGNTTTLMLGCWVTTVSSSWCNCRYSSTWRKQKLDWAVAWGWSLLELCRCWMLNFIWWE